MTLGAIDTFCLGRQCSKVVKCPTLCNAKCNVVLSPCWYIDRKVTWVNISFGPIHGIPLTALLRSGYFQCQTNKQTHVAATNNIEPNINFQMFPGKGSELIFKRGKFFINVSFRNISLLLKKGVKNAFFMVMGDRERGSTPWPECQNYLKLKRLNILGFALRRKNNDQTFDNLSLFWFLHK